MTASADGSYAWCGTARVYAPAFALGGVIETIGAGDTFCACVLNDLLEHDLDDPDEKRLSGMLRFANAAAYLVTTKKGAIRSMPTRGEVEAITRSGRERLPAT